MEQDELITRIACLLTGWNLDKGHAEELYKIVMPYIMMAGVKHENN